MHTATCVRRRGEGEERGFWRAKSRALGNLTSRIPIARNTPQGLEEASRLYFGESNVEGMLNTLLPLHEMMEKNGPTTLKEIAFVQAYGRELSEAYDW